MTEIDSKPITRRRGDTYRIRIEFNQDDGTPLPLDGTFRLVVTEQSAPTALDVPVMELAGTIVENGQAGADAILDFQQTPEDADNVGNFYYEVENTTAAGDIRTILEGPFNMIQDRAKSEEEFIWTPNETPLDGANVPADGSDGVLYFGVDFPAPGEITYQTRDTRRVIRSTLESSSDWRPVIFDPRGTGFPRRAFYSFGWEWRNTAFIKLSAFEFQVQAINTADIFAVIIDTRTGSPVITAYGQNIDTATGETIYADGVPPSTGGWVDSDWYEIKLKINELGETYFHIAPEGAPDNWIRFFSNNTMAPTALPFRLDSRFTRIRPEDPTAVGDLWRYAWSRL